MSRDYKPRPKGGSAGQRRKEFDQNPGIGLRKWLLITVIVIAFVAFLIYFRGTGSEQDNLQKAPQMPPNKTGVENGVTPKEEQKPEVKSAPKMPQFDFYTILPEKEVVVPEYEIKTRAREERVGKAKETHYLMQAGSFKTFKEGDRLRAKLALMGIESKVEKAKVGNVNWYRVKMGPYVQTDSVDVIRARLRKNGIDVIITETGQ
jgi:cell division protein FtsN